MSETTTCSAASLAAGEPLAATATQGTSWLLVEVRGQWGRDAVADSGLPAPVRLWLESFPGKVLFVRRPDRRRGVTLIRATVTEAGGKAFRQEIGSLDELAGHDLERGDPFVGPVVLICAHGRRDACCARLGPTLFDALAAQVTADRLWQSSHLGGHRFAPNVLVLPYGVQLGRIPLGRSAEVIELLASARIPLDLYRGRTIYAPPVQAAEIAVRSATGRDGIGDLQLIAHEGDRVTFSTQVGELSARVEERPGPVIPVSCGADPEPTVIWVAQLESAADAAKVAVRGRSQTPVASARTVGSRASLACHRAFACCGKQPQRGVDLAVVRYFGSRPPSATIRGADLPEPSTGSAGTTGRSGSRTRS